MSVSRDNMVKALKRHVLPVLREKGFRGSFPHFRRDTEKQTDLLTFQFSRYGGRFVVEIAKCSLGDCTAPWGEVIPANKVTAHHMNNRLRLGAKTERSDHWFKYDHILYDSDENAVYDVDELAKMVVPYLEGQAESWWATGEIADQA